MANVERVALVEAAYRIELPEEAWLRGLLEAAAPHFDHGLGVGISLLRVDEQGVHLEAGVTDQPPEREAQLLQQLQTTPSGASALLFHPGAFLKSAAAQLDGNPALVAAYQRMSRAHGFADALGLSALDSQGHGLLLTGLLPRRRPLPKTESRRMARIGAHLLAGLGLRRALASGGAAVQAVLAPRWQLLDDEAVLSRPDLRARIVEATRAVARRDEVLGAGPAALSPRQSQVALLAALGFSNKLIASTLGIGESSVAADLSAAQRRLGLPSRVALIQHLAPWLPLPGGSAGPPSVAALTPAEHGVLTLLLGGLDDEAIAAARCTSPRTVANQVASIFRKLGITSRFELAARMSRT